MGRRIFLPTLSPPPHSPPLTTNTRTTSMTRSSVSSLKSMWNSPIGSSPSTNQLSGTFSKLRGDSGSKSEGDGFVSLLLPFCFKF
ncbi:hypothetical protein L195_g051914, partial [Trifolium pratense]